MPSAKKPTRPKKPTRAPKASAKPRPAARKQWTFMVYLAGDNDLDGQVLGDLREMKSVGTGPGINVIAQVDRAGARTTTRRYELHKGTALAKDVVASLGETNMGDPAVLRSFVTWAIKAYPAARYMLVLWNHGSGMDDSNLYEGDYFSGATPPEVRKGAAVRGAGAAPRGAVVPAGTVRAVAKRGRRALFGSTVGEMVRQRAIAFDDQAKDFLDNLELQRVLAAVRKTRKGKLDVIGFDACLMSMLEVSYQIRQEAVVTCGSEEEEPGAGWPYDTILAALAAKPSMTPEELGRTVVGKYIESYRPSEGVTQSATALAAVGPLADAVDALGRALSHALEDGPTRDAIVAVRARVQEYTPPYDQYCDLGDLCGLLVHRVPRAELATAAGAVQTALSRAVLSSGTKGAGVASSHGIAIYFPKKRVSPIYGRLDFAKGNAWASFIAAYVAALTRP